MPRLSFISHLSTKPNEFAETGANQTEGSTINLRPEQEQRWGEATPLGQEKRFGIEKGQPVPVHTHDRPLDVTQEVPRVDVGERERLKEDLEQQRLERGGEASSLHAPIPTPVPQWQTQPNPYVLRAEMGGDSGAPMGSGKHQSTYETPSDQSYAKMGLDPITREGVQPLGATWENPKTVQQQREINR